MTTSGEDQISLILRMGSKGNSINNSILRMLNMTAGLRFNAFSIKMVKFRSMSKSLKTTLGDSKYRRA